MTLATFTRGGVDALGHSLGQTGNTFVGFILGQIASDDMVLNVCALCVNNCVHYVGNRHTLFGSNVGDALACLTGSLQHILADTKRIGEHGDTFGTALFAVCLTLGMASFAFFLRRGFLSLGDVGHDGRCAKRSQADHSGSNCFLHS